MYVEVIKAKVPLLGPIGSKQTIPDDEARVHIALGNVKEVEREVIRRPKRRYRRRDMQAEVTTEPTVTDTTVTLSGVTTDEIDASSEDSD